MKPWLVQLLMCILRSLFGEDERAESFILSEVYEPIRTWLQVYKMQSLHVNSWQLLVVRTRPFLTFRGREGKLLLSLFFLKLAWQPSFAWRSKPFFPCTSKLKFYANRSRGLRVMIRHTNRTKVHTSYLNILTWLSFPLFNVISKYVTSRLAILNVCKLRSTC